MSFNQLYNLQNMINDALSESFHISRGVSLLGLLCKIIILGSVL